MSLLRFEVRYPDGRKEVLSVDGERALIGSGAHCDVRLPVDQSAYEHVSIEVSGTIVRAAARAAEPPATLGGMPFENSPISPETPLGFGGIRIFVAVADSAALPGRAPQTRKEGTSPAIVLLGLVVIPACVYFLLTEETQSALEAAPNALPEIFATATQPCPQTSPDQAAALAADKLLVADAKRERHPFVPKDGITAVGLYEVAAACFKVADNVAASNEAAASGKALRTSIVSDFRARRIRLDHSLKVSDFDLARSDVKVLRAMTEGVKGEYVTWLAGTQQKLKVRGGT